MKFVLQLYTWTREEESSGNSMNSYVDKDFISTFSAQTQVNSSWLTDVVQGTVSGHQRWSTVNKTCPLYKRLCLCRCTCENVFIKLSRPRVFKFCRMDFFVFRLQTTWIMAPPADSHDRKLSQHQSIFSWKSINSLRPSWWKQNLFGFHLNFFFPEVCLRQFPERDGQTSPLWDVSAAAHQYLWTRFWCSI